MGGLAAAPHLDFLVTRGATYDFGPDGSLKIRSDYGFRTVVAGASGIGVFLIALFSFPAAQAVAVGAVGAGIVFAIMGRPWAVLDAQERVLIWGRNRIPFAELDRFLAIEHRCEERRSDLFSEILLGSRQVSRHEVYTRLEGELLVIGLFEDKGEASDLVRDVNELIAD